MQKALVIHPERCTGCRICELRCAYHHTAESNPSRSRIRVVKWEDQGLNFPSSCQQCQRCTVIDPCPVNAISRDVRTGAVIIDAKLCIGCRRCLLECVFGAPSIDPATRVAINCNLCNGFPKCAEHCPTNAIEYLPADEEGFERKKEALTKTSDMVKLALSIEKRE